MKKFDVVGIDQWTLPESTAAVQTDLIRELGVFTNALIFKTGAQLHLDFTQPEEGRLTGGLPRIPGYPGYFHAERQSENAWFVAASLPSLKQHRRVINHAVYAFEPDFNPKVQIDQIGRVFFRAQGESKKYTIQKNERTQRASLLGLLPAMGVLLENYQKPNMPANSWRVE